MAEENSNQDEQEEKPKGGGKKLLIVGLLAGLLVGGGGAAGFFIMQSGSAETHSEAEEAQAGAEIKPKLPDYQYAKIDGLQLPVFSNGRVLNYAVMDVSMEVIGNEDKLQVVRSNVLVRDSLIRHFSVNSIGREDNPSIVDYDKLSEKIKEYANAEAKREIVKRVVINQSRSF